MVCLYDLVRDLDDVQDLLFFDSRRGVSVDPILTVIAYARIIHLM